MKQCFIVGAGGFGREALSWALALTQGEWRIAGFLDANKSALENKNMPFEIVGDPATWVPGPDQVFIAGIGDSETRFRICSALRDRGARFISIVHPSAVLGINATIGEGCVVAPQSVISVNATLRAFVLVNIGASIGHDSISDEGATISSHCDLMGNAKLGRSAFMGSHSCVLPGVRIGDFAVVGAGSAVVRNVAPRTTVMGVPAQLLFRHEQ